MASLNNSFALWISTIQTRDLKDFSVPIAYISAEKNTHHLFQKFQLAVLNQRPRYAPRGESTKWVDQFSSSPPKCNIEELYRINQGVQETV